MTITMSKLGRDGQLGNQLFQYAMLRAVAEKTGYSLKIPKNYTAPKKDGLVELSQFHIEAEELKPAMPLPHNFIYERVAYNPDVFNQPDGTDFRGWYQSYKYFEDIEPIIRREFRFHSHIDIICEKFVDELRADSTTPIISLHVRRGDYLQNPDKFRILAPAYYENALRAVMSGMSKAIVLVFSDDPIWCKDNLTLPSNASPVFANFTTHWHDMCAMSKCDHHVIAASSFGWWGAWLNRNPNKIVIVPDPWFGSNLKEDTTDMIPPAWMKLTTMEGYL